MSNNEWHRRFAGSFGADEIPDRLTPIDGETAGRTLSLAYQRVTGFKPTAKVLSLLLGQWALETGNGSAVHNYNFGNIKHSSAETLFQTFNAGENVDGQSVVTPQKFAAYRSVEDGAVAFIKTLKAKPHWWAGLKTGNAEKFVRGLATAPKYFTADPTAYLKTLENRAANYLHIARKYGAILSPWGWAAVAGGSLLALLAVKRIRQRRNSEV